MTIPTFGYMAADRTSNAQLFETWRSVAITAFADEQVCDLSSFYEDSIADCDEILSKDNGKTLGKLRDSYYASLKQRRVPIRLPDIQSFFLYAFTVGLNRFAPMLSLPKEMDLSPTHFSVDEVLGRRFAIRGPEWLTDVANREMMYVENVFCDFQNEVLLPIGKSPKLDHRLLADGIATSFLWAFFGGMYWLKESVDELGKCVASSGGNLAPSGLAMYQVKKAMVMIDNAHVEHAGVAGSIFRSK